MALPATAAAAIAQAAAKITLLLTNITPKVRSAIAALLSNAPRRPDEEARSGGREAHLKYHVAAPMCGKVAGRRDSVG
jgi:hypothetical protein